MDSKTGNKVYYNIILLIIFSIISVIVFGIGNTNGILALNAAIFICFFYLTVKNIDENIFMFSFLVCFFTFLLCGQILNRFMKVYYYNFPDVIEKHMDDKKKFSIFANEIFTINIISTIIAYILLVFTVAAVPKFKDYAVIIAVFSIEILFTTIGTEWIYSIYEEYAYITIRSIIFKVISIILLFLLVKKPDDYIVYAGITVFANAGSNILNFIHAKKYCSLKFDIGLALKRHLKKSVLCYSESTNHVAIGIFVCDFSH